MRALDGPAAGDHLRRPPDHVGYAAGREQSAAGDRARRVANGGQHPRHGRRSRRRVGQPSRGLGCIGVDAHAVHLLELHRLAESRPVRHQPCLRTSWRAHDRVSPAGGVHRLRRHDAPEPAAGRHGGAHRRDSRGRARGSVPRLRRHDPVRRVPVRVLGVCPALDSVGTCVGDGMHSMSPHLPASSRNRWIRLGLQTAFGLALLYLWLRTVSLPEIAAHARVQSWWAVALMIVLFLLNSVIRARRWLMLLRPLAPVGMVRAFAMNAAGGLLHYVLPIRSGDAARAWWLWRRHRIPAGSALATIVIDKACDLAAVAVVLAALEVVALAGAMQAPRGLLGAAALAIALLGAVLGTALLGPRIARSRLARRVLPARFASGLAGQAFAFRAGARGLWSPELAIRLGALTVLALAIDAFNFTLLFTAVGVPVPLPKAMAAYPAILLSFAVPAGPGYLGNLEVAGSLVLGGGLGLASSVAAGAIVLYHAITAANALALGLLSFFLVGGRRRARSSGPRGIAGIGRAACREGVWV